MHGGGTLLSVRRLGKSRRRPLQPERHLHRAVHFDGYRQFGRRLLVTPNLLVQPAEAEVAVGREGARPQLVSVAIPDSPSGQLFEERPGFAQVARVEPLGEPAIDPSQ